MHRDQERTATGQRHLKACRRLFCRQGQQRRRYRPGCGRPVEKPVRRLRWRTGLFIGSTPPQVGDGNQNQAENPQPLAGQ